ncbi:hypothetical protein [Actinoallomurus vinaceus]|uniref:hypothetical protein n=1 Tax=Actinoallomurus vinaceus TaxID=1080074 RepID=UPI0031E5DA96
MRSVHGSHGTSTPIRLAGSTDIEEATTIPSTPSGISVAFSASWSGGAAASEHGRPKAPPSAVLPAQWPTV